MSTRYIAGINSVHNAISQRLVIDKLYVDQHKHNQRIIDLIALARAQHIAIVKLDKLKLSLLVPGSKHQGIVAAMSPPESDELNLEDILARDTPLLLVLDGIQDPHNLGACLRSAAAANVDAVVIPKNRSASLNTTVSKVASGGAETVPIFTETNVSRFLKKCQKQGLWSVALSSAGEQSIYHTDLRQTAIIIMGSEAKGISHNVLKHADFQAHIPMPGQMESLNVSVATGIVLFEALRQRLPSP